MKSPWSSGQSKRQYTCTGMRIVIGLPGRQVAALNSGFVENSSCNGFSGGVCHTCRLSQPHCGVTLGDFVNLEGCQI